MTLKNAAAGLPHGGGKAVLYGDPHMHGAEKEKLIRAFATAIADLRDYIPGPDMGTNESCMAWVHDEIRRAVGLPPEFGGIPLDEIGATGFGLAVAVEAAQAFGGVPIEGARVAVQGFGSVGKHAARFLAEKGAVLVAASDSGGTVAKPGGLDGAALIAHKKAGGALSTFPGATHGGRDAILDVPCDIWIPAARAGRADRRDGRASGHQARGPGREHPRDARGGSGPPRARCSGAARLHRERGRGDLRLGRVSRRQPHPGLFQSIAEKIGENVKAVLAEQAQRGIQPRRAAVELAERRVRKAMSLRRWG